MATDVPGSSTPIGGNEGDVVTETVADCSITVPVVPGWGLALLALLLLAAGARIPAS